MAMLIDFFVTQQGPGTEQCSALLSFLEGAGHMVNAMDIGVCREDDGFTRNADMIISYAIGGTQGAICRQALAAGKPVVVLELGYLGSRYQNIGVSLLYGSDDKLHNNSGYFLSTATMPDDRLRSLGIKVEAQNKAPVGKALLLGQVPGDSQLGGVNIITWARDMMSNLNQAGYEVDFRPHPGLIKPDMTLTEAMASHNLVAGFNSTALVEAIRMGVPFVCDEACQYAPMGTTSFMKPDAQPIEVRRQYLANLAYCQHNVEQFSNGEAWAQIARLLEMKGVANGQGT